LSRRTEKSLVQRILSGDQSACGEFVVSYHKSVYRALLHLCGDSHAAEDLTQDTFAAAWSNISGFNGRSKLATWLHRIAYFRFVSWNRRRQSDLSLQNQLKAQAFPPRVNGPPDLLVQDEQSRVLWNAVGRLDQAGREVIVLHYLQGLSFRQMAEVLNQPTGTVKWRTNQALGQLKTSLEERPPQ
jgi:RNA polymerase sigma-70 factor, ECF subfamily